MISNLTFLVLSTLLGDDPTITNRSYHESTPPRLDVERSFLYEPSSEWTYSHHPHITHFRGRFLAIWSNGRVDEDAPGQRVLIATSADAKHWSSPRPLVDSLMGSKGKEVVLTAAGFHQHDGKLVAYFGEYEDDRSNTHLKALTTEDGEHWGPILDMNVPVNPNHGPQKTRSGRLIIAGNFLFPYTDDPSGLSGWKVAGFHRPTISGPIDDNPDTFWGVANTLKLPVALCEGSFFQVADGSLVMPLRATGQGWKGKLWTTTSRDDGVTWSRPEESNFSDNDTKFHFGRLPDGRFTYVGSPDSKNKGARSPLVLSLSSDGTNFDRHFVIADSPYARKKPGKYKGGEYGYPHSLVHSGRMYVIVSRQKEAVEILSLPIKSLGPGAAR